MTHHGHGDTAPPRSHGSQEDFDADWVQMLSTPNPQGLIYPDADSGEQYSYMEAVKARQILDILHAHGQHAGRTLEYGCGAAGISIFLKNHGFEAYAVDVSLSALKVADLNNRRNSVNAVPLRRLAADALALPLRQGTFDVVMSYGLLEHFDEDSVRGLLTEVVQVLKPGGLFIADIVPARLNVRAIAVVLNFTASLLFHTLTGKWSRVGGLYAAYFGHYYESAFGPETWTRLLEDNGLFDVHVEVYRPFPPLAVSGPLERAYVGGMRQLQPLWQRFDRSQNWFTRRWGWIYLAWGIRRTGS